MFVNTLTILVLKVMFYNMYILFEKMKACGDIPIEVTNISSCIKDVKFSVHN